MIYLDGSFYSCRPLRTNALKERSGFWSWSSSGLDIPASGRLDDVPAPVERGGVEGDQTYYFANAARVRGKKKIDLRRDPPPDLAIEVVVTHDADEAVEVYRRFRVPEVWVCDQDG